jgi:hypothetical protein
MLEITTDVLEIAKTYIECLWMPNDADGDTPPCHRFVSQDGRVANLELQTLGQPQQVWTHRQIEWRTWIVNSVD